MKLSRRIIALLLLLALTFSLVPTALAEDKTAEPKPYVSGGEMLFQTSVETSTHSFTYYYSDEFFYSSSYTYQDHLASLSTSLLATCVPIQPQDNYEHASDNLRTFLTRCGFPDEHFRANDDFRSITQQNTAGAAASWKTLRTPSGEYTFIALGFRSMAYRYEWAGNFTIGSEGFHEGFSAGAHRVVQFLRDYIVEQGITGPIKIWTAGFSRSAALCNLTAGLLDDGALDDLDVTLDRNDLYAYTFGTPKGVSASQDPLNEKYGNIFNIISPSDLVCQIAPTVDGTDFDFHPYGVSLYLPTPFLDEDYFPLLDRFNEQLAPYTYQGEMPDDRSKFRRFRSLSSIFDIGGLVNDGLFVRADDTSLNAMLTIHYGLDTFFRSIVSSRANYVSFSQSAIQKVTSAYFGPIESEQSALTQTLTDEIGNEKISLVYLLFTGQYTELFSAITDSISKVFLSTGAVLYDMDSMRQAVYTTLSLVTSYFKKYPDEFASTLYAFSNVSNYMHQLETYMVWTHAFDSNYQEGATADYNQGVWRQLVIPCTAATQSTPSCPRVNATVYDTDGKIVGSLTDGKLSIQDDQRIFAAANYQGNTILYLPVYEDYTVVLSVPTSQQSSTLSVTVEEWSLLLNKAVSSQSWDDLTVTAENSLSVFLPSLTTQQRKLCQTQPSGVEYRLLTE